MSDDPYAKLAEAQKIYLNPTLELIQQNVPLHEHCYYILSKYPTNLANQSEIGFWEMLDQVISEDMTRFDETTDELIEYVVNYGGDSKIPLKDHLLSNLRMAKSKKDITYLKYLLGKEPKKRTMLKLVRKNPMINPDLATLLEINQSELNELTAVRLKMHLHRYIKNKELQDDNKVTLDDNLTNILGLSTSNEQTIHYFEFLKTFNSRFLSK
jgi:hypothetical protein